MGKEPHGRRVVLKNFNYLFFFFFSVIPGCDEIHGLHDDVQAVRCAD